MLEVYQLCILVQQKKIGRLENEKVKIKAPTPCKNILSRIVSIFIFDGSRILGGLMYAQKTWKFCRNFWYLVVTGHVCIQGHPSYCKAEYTVIKGWCGIKKYQAYILYYHQKTCTCYKCNTLAHQLVPPPINTIACS